MYSFRMGFCGLMVLVLGVGCGQAASNQAEKTTSSAAEENPERTVGGKARDPQADGALPPPSASPSEQAPSEPALDVDVPPAILPPFPPTPNAVLPVYSGGGGGGGPARRRPQLPCENNTSDCNDKNPCTFDTCENDTCVHVLDTSKDQFGSCEVDGSSCTIGKCILFDASVLCHEQRREFIAGALGCQDANT